MYIEKLKQKLTQMGVQNFHVSLADPSEPGYVRPDPEEVARQILESLEAIERGEFEEIDDFDD